MDKIEALHGAARQYCSERAAFWREQYSRLYAAGRATIEKGGGEWAFTREAYDIFPRYQTLEAIQDEIEHFLPNHFASLDEARSILALAGETAQSVMSRQTEPTAIAADFEEHQLFSNFVRAVDEVRLSQQQALTFRRVLGDGEHQAMHAALADKWGKWYGGACDRRSPESEVVTLHTAVMEFPGSYSGLRTALVEHSVGRLFELREHGCGYEIPVELAGFKYTGAEGFWTNGAYDWLVYASHESSITFGSCWLVAKMREILPEFSRYIYKGWDLEAYA